MLLRTGSQLRGSGSVAVGWVASCRGSQPIGPSPHYRVEGSVALPRMAPPGNKAGGTKPHHLSYGRRHRMHRSYQRRCTIVPAAMQAMMISSVVSISSVASTARKVERNSAELIRCSLQNFIQRGQRYQRGTRIGKRHPDLILRQIVCPTLSNNADADTPESGRPNRTPRRRVPMDRSEVLPALDWSHKPCAPHYISTSSTGPDSGVCQP